MWLMDVAEGGSFKVREGSRRPNVWDGTSEDLPTVTRNCPSMKNSYF